MQRLPSVRRKENYVLEIDASRKRSRLVYENNKDFFHDVEYEEVNGNNASQYTLLDVPTTSKLPIRRYRTVNRKSLYHNPEHYRASTPPKIEVPQILSTVPSRNQSAPLNVYVPNCYTQQNRVTEQGSTTDYIIYNELDDFSNAAYYNSTDEIGALYNASQIPPQHRTTFLRARVNNSNNSSFSLNVKETGIDSTVVNSSANTTTPGINENENVDRIYHQTIDDVDENVLIERTLNNPDAYEFLDLQNGEVQEHVEVVDDTIEDHTLGDEDDDLGHIAHHHFHNQFKFSKPGPIDLYKLYEVMGLQAQKFHSNESLMDYFLVDPAMGNPLNVLNLIESARNATSEMNAQTIASLAMQINHLKKDVIKIKQDLIDLRSVCLARESPFISPDRKFEPLAEVSQDWSIPEIPPLVPVDLVMLARNLGNLQSGKTSLRNEDLIRRFVRSALEKLVPRRYIPEFTVRDKGRDKDGVPRDIGEFAKSQIIGIILDLLGLHNLSESDSRGRAERAYYYQMANRLMKCAIYDMRRIAPKKKKDPYANRH